MEEVKKPQPFTSEEYTAACLNALKLNEQGGAMTDEKEPIDFRGLSNSEAWSNKEENKK